MNAPDNHEAQWPDPASLYPAQLIDAPHPATLSPDVLLQSCDRRTQRRSGPGGQHRNKTSSGVFLEHRPTGQIGEATERRSQAQNRAISLIRLRMKLAVFVRTPSPLRDSMRTMSEGEAEIRQTYSKSPLRFAEGNVAGPAVMAMLMDDLWVAGGQPSLVAEAWSVSTSSLVRLLRSHSPAIAMINKIREHHGRRPLK